MRAVPGIFASPHPANCVTLATRPASSFRRHWYPNDLLLYREKLDQGATRDCQVVVRLVEDIDFTAIEHLLPHQLEAPVHVRGKLVTPETREWDARDRGGLGQFLGDGIAGRFPHIGTIPMDTRVHRRPDICSSRCMGLRNTILRWLHGVADLFTYHQIPGYRRLTWLARKRLDVRVIGCALRSAGFWRAVFGLLVATVLAQSLSWHFDLQGAGRDVCRALPMIFFAPWLGAARKRHIVSMLRFRDASHRQQQSSV